jgi:hypothetical protein
MFLEQWLKIVGHKITEGSDYGWKCYGPDVYSLNSVTESNGADIGVIFNPKTKQTFEATVVLVDGNEKAAYRWIHPDYIEGYQKESTIRQVEDLACDDLNWINLDIFQDWAEKTTAIRNGKPYDKRVMIQLDVDDSTFSCLAHLAHAADMTLNQYVENILRSYIERARN